MKILLVKPYPELLVAKRLQEGFLHLEPLELEIVAGGVPEEDEVFILDLSLESKPVEVFMNELVNISPDMVGFSGYSTNVRVIKNLAKIVRNYDLYIITFVGGVHATLLPQDYAVEHIDIIVRGEGGTVIREMLRRFKKGETLHYDNRALSPKDPDFVAKTNLPPPEYPLVDEIPRPRRDLVQRSKYFCVWTSSQSGKLDTMFPSVASLRSSIGCAFSCSFCVIPFLMHGKYLQRSPIDVVDEIAAILEDHIYFVDDEMFLNPARVTKIAELLIERGIKKKYISWARSDTIDKYPEVFKIWKKAGLELVYVGLESMDKSRLDEYSKRTDVETNRKAIEILKQLGITLHAAFIVHPDFTRDDFRRLEKEVKNLCPAEVTFTVLSPSPGTKSWYDNKDRFICDPYRFYDCMHSVLPTRLPLKRFYKHFGRLYSLALRANPIRVNKVKIPLKDLYRAITGGTKYIFSLYNIYKDYLTDKRW
ncbi:MAG: B12-binding domain-containing radical SAM protein [Proteobacteria bacterium]|nr:B12-binding domain-containing radical SAM protein [Pseudomonadota bacterium]